MSSNDSIRRTVLVAGAVCLVCSVLVSGAAVSLKSAQETNRSLDRKRNILAAAGLLKTGDDIESLYQQRIDPRVVDLETGEFAEDVDPAQFDQRKASRDPAFSTALTTDQDVASIKRRSNLANVYLVRNEAGELQKIILPVHGYGLWSTMYAFLALDEDTKTVVGLKFYDQAETPGLGGEIANPDWQAQWEGKQVYGEDWEPAIELAKGGVDPASPKAEHQVDSLSGATLTANGVENLMHFWLGENGFGPFLAQLREGSNDG